MNQLATNTERLPTDSVGMSTGSNGAKIAPQNLAEVVKFAEVMCRADIALPKHLRGNAGACMAVALQALDWQMNPFAVASKSYQVNGAIAYEAQLIAAVVNTRSGIKGRLKYRYDGTGNDMTCTVTGTIDGDELEYTTPPIGSITTKNSPLWKSDPQQQLGYFAARSWARRHTPEVILGVYDREEAEQFTGPDNAKDVTPQPSVMARLKAAQEATQQLQDEREGFNHSFVHAETHDALTGEILDTPSDEADSPPVTSDAGDTPDEQSPASEPEDATPAPSSGSAHIFPIGRADLIDCCRKLMFVVVDPDIATPENRLGVLESVKDAWKDQLPPELHEHIKGFFLSAQRQIKALNDDTGKAQKLRRNALEHFAEMLECSVEDLGGRADG